MAHLLNNPVALYTVDPVVVYDKGQTYKLGQFVGIFADAEEFQKALNEQPFGSESHFPPASQREQWPRELRFPAVQRGW